MTKTFYFAVDGVGYYAINIDESFLVGEGIDEDVAEMIAEYYYHNHDGYRDVYPITLDVYKYDGLIPSKEVVKIKEEDLVATFKVDIEQSPSFSARKV